MMLDDSTSAKSTLNRPINHYRESELLAAILILIFLTQDRSIRRYPTTMIIIWC
jgi:hypothetical protein